VGADKLLCFGMNHQIHPFKGVRAQQDVFLIGDNYRFDFFNFAVKIPVFHRYDSQNDARP
jgi:hypothetical protein